METISLLHKSSEKERKAFVIPAEVSGKNIPIDFEDVKEVRLASTVSLKSMLWAVIFFLFFLDLCLRRNPNDWFFSSMAALAIGFVVLSLIFLDKQHHLSLYMTDGTKLKLNIAKDNKDAAEAFVILTNKRLSKK